MRAVYSRLLAVLIVLVSCVGMASAQSKPATWTAPPAITKQLAKPISLGFGNIRLPKGIRLQRKQAPFPGSKAWVGSGAGWGPVPTMAIYQSTLTAEEAAAYDMEDVTEIFTIVLGAHIYGLQLTALENGNINGTPFTRVRWSGIDKELRVPIHGFIYTTKRGRQYIQIMSQQLERTRERLRYTDASALTFRLK